MSVVVVPISSCEISTNLVVGLCILDDIHIDIRNTHAFSMTAQPCNWTDVGYADL